MTIAPEKLAEKFHETYETLAPSFNHETREVSRKPWEEVPENNKRLMVAVCRILLNDLGAITPEVETYFEREQHFDAPSLAHDRNAWQRRLGALITTVEAFVARVHQEGVAPSDCQTLLDDTYRVVNTDPRSGHMDEPLADVARLTVRHTLEAALNAGLILPGPKAPEWMRPSEE